MLHFRSRLNRLENRLTKADAEFLKRYDWPGNVRELQNVIDRAMILSTGTRLRLDLVLTQTRSDKQTELPVNSSSTKIMRGDDLKRIQRESIVRALEHAHWRISGAGGASELLAINPNTLRLADALAENQAQGSGLSRRWPNPSLSAPVLSTRPLLLSPYGALLGMLNAGGADAGRRTNASRTQERTGLDPLVRPAYRHRSR